LGTALEECESALLVKLLESEKLYRSLPENILNGLAYCQMHFDENERPLDCTYMYVNSAFETQTGLKNVVGKKQK
jgi:hypothetical protein